MISAEDIVKNYGRTPVLHGMSFRAARNQITLLVGPNGAGKSTSMKIFAGLARPNNGTARIDKIDIVTKRIKAQRLLSYLPQRPSFHPRMTCAEILRFYSRLRGTPSSRYEAVIELAGLREFERVRTGELSGGTRQRLGLAVLMLPDAPVLLLDEPGLSLDPSWRKRLQDTLRFEAERGKTVLVTTHLVAEWNNVAHRCLLCRDGKIERELDPSNLPQNFDEMESTARSADAKSTIDEPRFSIVS
jgi:ABC-2 type transport system ATP-binding protein